MANYHLFTIFLNTRTRELLKIDKKKSLLCKVHNNTVELFGRECYRSKCVCGLSWRNEYLEKDSLEHEQRITHVILGLCDPVTVVGSLLSVVGRGLGARKAYQALCSCSYPSLSTFLWLPLEAKHWLNESNTAVQEKIITHNIWTPHWSPGRSRITCLCFIFLYINTSQRFYFEISVVLQLTEAFHLVLSLKMSVILKYLGKFS